MNKYHIILLSILLNLSALNILAQGFSELKKQAKKLYKSKEYALSGQTYDKAFKQKQGRAVDYYDAACSWALAGNKDKAFDYLDLALDKGWHNKDWLSRDKDLQSLHAEKNWDKILKKAQANLDMYEKDFDKELQSQLEQLYIKDQTLRQLYREAEQKFGQKSEQMTYFWSVVNKQDKENEKEIIEILDKKGWPGTSLVGGKANKAVFLVIQHAPLDMQEKYLPMLRESVTKGESQGQDLALLEDRVAVRNGKPQIYGSQITRNKEGKWEFDKIKDPEYVNQRRKAIGLSPIEIYAKGYGIVWTVKQKEK